MKTTQLIWKYKSWNKKIWRRRPFIYWILTVVTQAYQRQCYGTQCPWTCLWKRSRMVDIETIRGYYMLMMKFLGTHTHLNGRVTLDWHFQIGKCAQIREKLRKIRLLVRYTGAVLSVICYSCREESVTRLVRNHKARYRVPQPCTRIFYRRVPGFAIDCPCGIWCRGLTICPCMLVHFLEI